MIQVSAIPGLGEYHPHTHLPFTQMKLKYHLAGRLLWTDNDNDIQVYFITRRLPKVDKMLDKYVPIDMNKQVYKSRLLLIQH